VIPFEDNNSTELDHDFVTSLIFELERKWFGGEEHDSDDPLTKLRDDDGWPFPTSDD